MDECVRDFLFSFYPDSYQESKLSLFDIKIIHVYIFTKTATQRNSFGSKVSMREFENRKLHTRTYITYLAYK